MAQQKKQVNTTQKVEEKPETVKTPAPNIPKSEKPSTDKIEVETTGKFGLYDPIARLDIPHDKAIMVTRTSFIERQLELKRLKEV